VRKRVWAVAAGGAARTADDIVANTVPATCQFFAHQNWRHGCLESRADAEGGLDGILATAIAGINHAGERQRTTLTTNCVVPFRRCRPVTTLLMKKPPSGGCMSRQLSWLSGG
jgi:hypothetical protein